MRPFARTPSLLAALVSVAVALTACGGGSTGSASSPTSAATETRGPLTLDQCSGEKRDRKVTYDAIPQRVFTLDPQSAEFLIALGLGDKLVATWDTYPQEVLKTVPQYAEQLSKVKTVGDQKTWPPPVETIVGSKPDFVLTTYRLDMPGYLDASRLEKDTGIKSYTFLSNCIGAPMTTLDPIFEDITNLGTIFGVPDRAAALIATMKGQLAQAATLTANKPKVKIWEYAGEDVPYPAGGTGIANAVMSLAGADNVFSDVGQMYAEVSWEQVIKRDPAVIWLQTDAGPGFIQTEDALKKAVDKNPSIASIDGIAKKRYLVVPYTTAGTLSVHNAEAVLEFARQLQKITPSV